MSTALTPHLQELADEVVAAVIEQGKIASEAAIKSYWYCGEILRRYEQNGTNITEAVKQLPTLLPEKFPFRSENSLWNAVKCYDQSEGDEEYWFRTKHGAAISVNKMKELIGYRKPKEESKDGCRHCKLHCV